MPKVTVSLVTFNSERFLPFSLQSLQNQTFKDFELVVYDNGSTDASIEVVKKYFPQARITQGGHNSGFAHAQNELIRSSTSPIVFLFNPDVILEPAYLHECVAFFDENPQAGALTGKLIRAEWKGLTLWEKTDKIDTCGLVIKRSQNVKDLYQYEPVNRLEANKEVFGVSGAAALYRCSALEHVAEVVNGLPHYFDEDMFMYKEDVDIAYRLRACGWKAYCVVAAIGYHFRGKYSKWVRENKLINRWSYRNHWYVLLKNINKQLFWKNAFWIICYEVAKLGYVMLFEWSTLGALGDVFRNKKRMRTKNRAIMAKRMISDNEMQQWFL